MNLAISRRKGRGQFGAGRTYSVTSFEKIEVYRLLWPPFSPFRFLDLAVVLPLLSIECLYFHNIFNLKTKAKAKEYK
jgi:hypothetical protein